MKRCRFFIIMLYLFIALYASTSQAELATPDSVQAVAENWLRLIVHEKGHWGGSTQPRITEINKLKGDNRFLGYFIPVNPLGFMVVSKYVELAPIKFYSDMGSFNPELDTGSSGFIKDALARVLNRLEKRLSSKRSAITEDVGDAVEINYRRAWTELSIDLETKNGLTPEEIPAANYKGGQVLLTTEWSQLPPYNDQCPWPVNQCQWPPCNFNNRAVVGCVALAGVQTMRYWNWPPYGVNAPYNVYFDWSNMPDTLIIGDRPLTCTRPQEQVDAVAQLCALVGDAVYSPDDYSCVGTSGQTSDLVDAFEDEFRYSDDADVADRLTFPETSPKEWFDKLKTEIDQNRPIPYRIPGHAVVADGWRETGTEPWTIRHYHINWGHGEDLKQDDGTWKNFWYALDAIPGSDPDDEYMLISVVPENAVGPSMAGDYSQQTFPYRYFDQDTSGNNATFGSGQMLQALEGVRIRGTSSTGYYVRFLGASASPTKVYTGGDLTKGICIKGSTSIYGSIRLSNNGSISLARLRPPRYPRAVAVNTSQILLSWDQGRGMETQQVVIERKIGTNGNFSYLTTVSETLYGDTGLNPSTLYTYRLKTVEPTGLSSKYSMEFLAITQ